MTSGNVLPPPLGAPGKCPECGRPADRASQPFCSPRCKSVDLYRWLTGRYVIAGPDNEMPGQGEDDERA